jgi:hypothetical protein
MRTTTARTIGLSRWALRSRTTSAPSMMIPSSSTTATRGPNTPGLPSRPRDMVDTTRTNSSATPM